MKTINWSQIAECAEQNYMRVLRQMLTPETDSLLKEFIGAATNLDSLDNYKYFNATAERIVEHIKGTQGASGSRAFLRAVLERTISIWISEGRYQQLPPLCARFHAAQLDRIAKDNNAAADWLDLGDDLFQKEFGIVSLRLYVAGSNLVDHRCGIPRSIIFREGLIRAFSNLRFILYRKGFKPYFQGHLHKFMLSSLSEEGRNDFYRCCAELFALPPNSLGVFCSSWYYDPALDRISPWLSYLRKIPVSNGAQLFFVEEGGVAINYSLAKSQTRRRLYEEGKYHPRTYMFVWGRNDLIAWANKAHADKDSRHYN